jgi:hypothetical protein
MLDEVLMAIHQFAIGGCEPLIGGRIAEPAREGEVRGIREPSQGYALESVP